MVCRSVTLVSPAKTAEPIKMPFGLRTQAGPGHHVLDVGNFLGKGTPIYSIGRLHGTMVERRSLAGELPCPVLDLWLPGDYLTVRYRSTSQANSAFHPFGVDK